MIVCFRDGPYIKASLPALTVAEDTTVESVSVDNEILKRNNEILAQR